MNNSLSTFGYSQTFEQVTLISSTFSGARWFSSKKTKENLEKNSSPQFKEKIVKKKENETEKSENASNQEPSNEKGFRDILDQIEKQMDKTVAQNWKEELQKKKEEKINLNKTPQQVIKDFKQTIENELSQLPTINLSPNKWAISQETIDNSVILLFSHKDRFREIKISFPSELEEEEEDQTLDGLNLEDEGNEAAKEEKNVDPANEAKNFQFKLADNDTTPKLSNENPELDFSQLPPSHPCNIEFIFFDAFEKPKGSLHMQAVIEEDHNIYVQRMTPKMGDKFGLSFEVMKLSSDFQTGLYELLEVNHVNRELGVAIKQYLNFYRAKQFSAFLNEVKTLLD